MEWRRILAGVILLVFCFFAGFVARSPDEDADTENSYSTNKSSIGSATNGNDYAADAPQEAHHYAPHWYTPLKRPVWLSLIVSVFGIAVIAWQSYETRRAAKATQIAAEATQVSARAAELNAQVLLNSERAWLIPRNFVMPMEIFNAVRHFHIRVVNYGRSPAFLTDWVCHWVALEHPPTVDSLDYSNPSRNQYGVAIAPMQRENIFTVPEVNDPDQIQAAIEGTRHLYVYGLLRYGDGLGPEIHETYFCYQYHRREPEPGTTVQGWSAEPPEANRST
jgi:hypothetical protein